MKFFGHELTVEASSDALQVHEVREKGRAGAFLPFQELVGLLRDPVSKAPLKLRGDQLEGPDRTYPIRNGNPELFPVDPHQLRGKLSQPEPLQTFPKLSPLEQYCAFGMLKAAGDNNNLDYNDVWYGRHLYRASKVLRNARGRFLDIGCDDAFLSRGMLAPDVQYVGLEPATGPSQALRVGGLGEFLPFADASFDGVGFQTSLDHVFDYHLALSEARRVLRPGGKLYLATLLWTERAHLYTDTVHFHHFRPGQIEAALSGAFELDQVDAYVWKGNTHRFGVYLSVVRK